MLSADYRLSSLLVALVLAASAPAFSQTPAGGAGGTEVDRARRAYTAGAAAYQLGQFEEAARRFEEAYRIMNLPSMLFDIAQSHRRLAETTGKHELLRKAREVYQAFLREAPARSARRPQATQFVEQIDKTLTDEVRRRRASLLAKAVGREGVWLAEQLLADGAAREALAVLQRVAAERGNPRDVVVGALQRTAIAAGKLGDQTAAELAFKRLLALEPGYVPADLGDRSTAAAYAAARRYWQGKRPLAITHTPPGAVGRGQPARILVTLESDPLAMVNQVAVFYRLSGAGAYSVSKAAVGGGAVEIPALFLSGLGGSKGVDYYVAALDDREGELYTIGKPNESFMLMVGGEPAEEPGITSRPGRRVAWYRTWWVWAIAGGVVAGTTTGVYFGTRGGDAGAPVVHIPSP